MTEPYHVWVTVQHGRIVSFSIVPLTAAALHAEHHDVVKLSDASGLEERLEETTRALQAAEGRLASTVADVKASAERAAASLRELDDEIRSLLTPAKMANEAPDARFTAHVAGCPACTYTAVSVPFQLCPHGTSLMHLGYLRFAAREAAKKEADHVRVLAELTAKVTQLELESARRADDDTQARVAELQRVQAEARHRRDQGDAPADAAAAVASFVKTAKEVTAYRFDYSTAAAAIALTEIVARAIYRTVPSVHGGMRGWSKETDPDAEDVLGDAERDDYRHMADAAVGVFYESEQAVVRRLSKVERGALSEVKRRGDLGWTLSDGEYAQARATLQGLGLLSLTPLDPWLVVGISGPWGAGGRALAGQRFALTPQGETALESGVVMLPSTPGMEVPWTPMRQIFAEREALRQALLKAQEAEVERDTLFRYLDSSETLTDAIDTAKLWWHGDYACKTTCDLYTQLVKQHEELEAKLAGLAGGDVAMGDQNIEGVRDLRAMLSCGADENTLNAAARIVMERNRAIARNSQAETELADAKALVADWTAKAEKAAAEALTHKALSKIQPTTCALCLKPGKWCPWRDDAVGYVCAQCLVDQREDLRGKLSASEKRYEALRDGEHERFRLGSVEAHNLVAEAGIAIAGDEPADAARAAVARVRQLEAGGRHHDAVLETAIKRAERAESDVALLKRSARDCGCCACRDVLAEIERVPSEATDVLRALVAEALGNGIGVDYDRTLLWLRAEIEARKTATPPATSAWPDRIGRERFEARTAEQIKRLDVLMRFAPPLSPSQSDALLRLSRGEEEILARFLVEDPGSDPIAALVGRGLITLQPMVGSAHERHYVLTADGVRWVDEHS